MRAADEIRASIDADAAAAVAQTREPRPRRQIPTLLESPPHFATPPGVVLRPLLGGEYNNAPVLVCRVCKAPTIHVGELIEHWRCTTCNTVRSW